MSRDHRTWQTVAAYFREIPINNDLFHAIKVKLKSDKRVLIMVLKEDEKLNPKYTIKEKQEAICDLFSDELIQGKVLIIHVPDIQNFKRLNL